MKTINIDVYQYDELSEKAKEKARDWWREGNTYDNLSDDMLEHLKGLLKQHRIKCDDPKVFYSLSYCQGDGAMFEGVVTWKRYTITIKHSGHYSHYNSKTIDMVVTKTDEPAYGAENELFNALYVDICKDLAKYGYSLIEYEDSEENIAENIRANEYDFTIDGSRSTVV